MEKPSLASLLAQGLQSRAVSLSNSTEQRQHQAGNVTVWQGRCAGHCGVGQQLQLLIQPLAWERTSICHRCAPKKTDRQKERKEGRKGEKERNCLSRHREFFTQEIKCLCPQVFFLFLLPVQVLFNNSSPHLSPCNIYTSTPILGGVAFILNLFKYSF